VAAEEAPELPYVEETGEAPAEEPEELEEDVILYVPPQEEVVVADKPQIRFKEDIFAPQSPVGEGKKRGKKKKAGRDDSEAVGAKRKRKVHDTAATPAYDDLIDEQV
jgi:hypothetical protein